MVYIMAVQSLFRAPIHGRDGTFEFLDNYKGTRAGKQRLFPAGTVLAGKTVPRA